MSNKIGTVRKAKLAFLSTARALGLFALSRALTARGVRVLCYHGAWMGDPRYPGDCMFIGRQTFADRLDLIRAQGYPVITLGEAMDALRHARPLPPCATVITIDDGWYSTCSLMAPELESRGLPATLYCDTANLTSGTPVWHVMARYIHLALGAPSLDEPTQALYDAATNPDNDLAERERATRSLAAALGVDLEPLLARRAFQYMPPDELRAMFERGTIGVELHTHNHSLHDMSPAAVRREVEANRETLAAILGVPASHFQHFCFPSGRTSPSAEAALDNMGIASSTTTDAGLAFPGVRMQDVPRFLDGENVFRVEFEAEMSGFSHLLRAGLSSLRRHAAKPAGLPKRSATSVGVPGEARS